MLEIKHLTTLQALADTHSINRAADKLCMTQSALSHQIKLLEQHLELELFKRKSHPIEWTPAGQTLLQTAHQVLPLMRHAEKTLLAQKQGENGRLWIGVDCHTCFEWLLPLLRPYHARWPNVDLDIVPSFHQQPLKQLQQRKLDFVITSDPEPMADIDYTALFSYELVAILPLQHRLLSHDFLSAEALADETLIVYPVEEEKLAVFKEFLTPAGIRPKLVQYSELTIMMLQRVEVGRGLCILPKWLFKNQTDFQHLPWRPLGAEGLWSKLYAATQKAQTQMPYIQEMIQQVADEMSP